VEDKELNEALGEWGGLTEEYKFYNGKVTLRFDPEEHVYFLVTENGLVPQAGVTTVVHIIDKSNALIPWGCKMMGEKLLKTVSKVTNSFGDTFTAPLTIPELEKWVAEAKSAHKEKIEEAANVGKEAHAWIEAYIKEELNGAIRILPLPTEERAANCCKAAIDWMREHNVRWICTERKIYSRTYQYAGTLDGIALVDSCDDSLCCPEAFKGRRSLVDWKSSNYLYNEYLFQTAAYQQAYEEETKEIIEDRWIIRLGKDDGEFDAWHIGAGAAFQQDFQAFLNCLDLTRSVESVTLRMKSKKDFIKSVLKERAKAEKEAQLRVKCKKADSYKGVKPPSCGCETCEKKYAEKQQEKLDKA
jgi:hypothetical protein